MDPLWSETCWSTFKYFNLSTYYILCISWITKCFIIIDARCTHEEKWKFRPTHQYNVTNPNHVSLCCILPLSHSPTPCLGKPRKYLKHSLVLERSLKKICRPCKVYFNKIKKTALCQFIHTFCITSSMQWTEEMILNVELGRNFKETCISR